MARQRKLKPDEIEEVFLRFQNNDPAPRGELYSVNNYTFLVAVALSAQATDIGVNKATRPLFDIVDTPTKMLELGENALIDHIKTIGLYRTKAKNIMSMAQSLIENHNGVVPNTRPELEALAGVGRKTANVVLNNCFGQPTIAIDTHLFRVSNRTGMAFGKTPLAVELGLLKVIPDHFKLHAHHWMILHGRYICKARKPMCSKCLINDLCTFQKKELLD